LIIILLRDSKRAAELDDEQEEQENYRPRTRVEQEAHNAYLAAKEAEKKE
jgi:hypothetical protein